MSKRRKTAVMTGDVGSFGLSVIFTGKPCNGKISLNNPEYCSGFRMAMTISLSGT